MQSRPALARWRAAICASASLSSTAINRNWAFMAGRSFSVAGSFSRCNLCHRCFAQEAGVMPLHGDGGFARDELVVPAAQQASRHWAGEEIPLYLGRPKPAHLVERGRRFYPFDDRLDPELLRESEGCTDDPPHTAPARPGTWTVDLYAVDRAR